MHSLPVKTLSESTHHPTPLREMFFGQEVWGLTYPDFVGAIGQENTPPGGIKAIESWARHARIGPTSRVLDLACSTGFSSRGLSRISGCSAVGVDLSDYAIKEAHARALKDGVSNRVDYVVGDACELPFGPNEFTHAVAGCCFGFISDRDAALASLAKVLKPRGRLCVANFAYTQTPPPELVEQVEACVGFQPDPRQTQYFWNLFFGQRFKLVEEHLQPLSILSDREIIEGVALALGPTLETPGLCSEVAHAVFERLCRDRLIFNDHRAYQSSTVQVWERR